MWSVVRLDFFLFMLNWKTCCSNKPIKLEAILFHLRMVNLIRQSISKLTTSKATTKTKAFKNLEG